GAPARMSFLQPLALLLAALSVPLLLLYFLKVRRRQATVPSLMLWKPSLRDREASTFFQRLQRDPLLILQLLALLALAFALARPAVTVMGHGAKRIVIVLDSSASMKATDVEPSRFVRAQREALGLVGRLGVGAEVMVIEAAVQPRVLAPFSRDRQLTLAAIRGAQPRDLPNRLGEAVRTARALLGQGSRAETHAFTAGAHRFRRPRGRRRRLCRHSARPRHHRPAREPRQSLPREGAVDRSPGQARGAQARRLPRGHGDFRRGGPRWRQPHKARARPLRPRQYRAARCAHRGAGTHRDARDHGLGPEASDHAPGGLRQDRHPGRHARAAPGRGEDPGGGRGRPSRLPPGGAEPEGRLLRLRPL